MNEVEEIKCVCCLCSECICDRIEESKLKYNESEFEGYGGVIYYE
jgi:hypothetical protein